MAEEIKSRPVRYAVVGLGWIAQSAMLPAFVNAKENSCLTALVSGDQQKLKEVGKLYGIRHLYTYDEYDACLRSGQIDAVYIALPNNQHLDYTLRAASAGIHVLCEKPLALSSLDCERMIEACQKGGVKLMTAYRLHFDAMTLKAIELVESGALGEPRYLSSSFSQSVKERDIRLQKRLGGGPLLDMGVYCINAARYLFRDEPTEVFGLGTTGRDPRFTEVEENFSAVLQFPGGRSATFTCSLGSAPVDELRIVGSKGELRMSPAYNFDGETSMWLTRDGKTEPFRFPKRDQFGPELVYFSRCILMDQQPEPSGVEGLADLRIVEALYRSAALGRAVTLPPFLRRSRPTVAQRIDRPAIKEPGSFHARAPAAS